MGHRIGLRLLASAILVTGLACYTPAESDGQPPPKPKPKTAFTRYENREGRYTFRYPKEWKLAEDGTRTSLINPAEDTIVAFGIEPDISLKAVSDNAFNSVRKEYTEVRRTGTQREVVGRRPALVYSGIGVNQRGVSIRFVLLAIDGRSSNYSIVVFTEYASDPRKVLPPVNRIVGSFKGR